MADSAMEVTLRVIREVPQEFDAASDTRCCCFRIFESSSLNQSKSGNKETKDKADDDE